MSILLDIIVIVVILVCVFSGFKKGVLLSAATVIALLISIFLGGTIARSYGPKLSEKISPYMTWITEDATDEVIAKMTGTLESIDNSEAHRIIHDSFTTMGLSQEATDSLTEEAYQLMIGTGYDVRTSVALVFIDMLCYIAIFVVAFAIIGAILLIILNVVGSSYEMPNLKWVDWIGGPVMGLIYGFIIVMVFALLLRYGIAIIPKDWNLFTNAKLIQYFVSNNFVASMLGI